MRERNGEKEEDQDERPDSKPGGGGVAREETLGEVHEEHGRRGAENHVLHDRAHVGERGDPPPVGIGAVAKEQSEGEDHDQRDGDHRDGCLFRHDGVKVEDKVRGPDHQRGRDQVGYKEEGGGVGGRSASRPQ